MKLSYLTKLGESLTTKSIGRLIIIRHGESQCNIDGIIGGLKGCTGLSSEGKKQARKLQRRLQTTHELGDNVVIYSSDLPRAIETAKYVARAVGSEEVFKDKALKELDPGEGDGLTWKEFLDKYGVPNFKTDPDKPVADGGESWNQMMNRSRNALIKITNRHIDKTVVAVCHGGVIQASMARFLELKNNGVDANLKPEYTSITEWRGRNRIFKLVRYNDFEHLLNKS